MEAALVVRLGVVLAGPDRRKAMAERPLELFGEAATFFFSHSASGAHRTTTASLPWPSRERGRAMNCKQRDTLLQLAEQLQAQALTCASAGSIAMFTASMPRIFDLAAQSQPVISANARPVCWEKP